MNVVFEMIRQDTVLTYIEVLYWHLARVTEKSQKLSCFMLSGLILNLATRIQSDMLTILLLISVSDEIGKLLTTSQDAAGLVLAWFVEGKESEVAVHVMKTHGENIGTGPIKLTPSARLRFVGNFMPGGFTLRKQHIDPKSGWPT